MFRGINWTVAAAAFTAAYVIALTVSAIATGHPERIAPALAWYGMTFTVATLVLRLWRRP